MKERSNSAAHVIEERENALLPMEQVTAVEEDGEPEEGEQERSCNVLKHLGGR